MGTLSAAGGRNGGHPQQHHGAEEGGIGGHGWARPGSAHAGGRGAQCSQCPRRVPGAGAAVDGGGPFEPTSSPLPPNAELRSLSFPLITFPSRIPPVWLFCVFT